MRNVLIDAGPLIALFATDDRHHARFDAALRLLATEGLRLLTTWPCVVEAAYLLDTAQRFELLKWIELGGVQVYAVEQHHLGDMVGWMRQYSEASSERWTLPMRRCIGSPPKPA